MLLLSMSFSYYMKASFKSYGLTHFKDDLFLTMSGMIAFISSAFAKFGWGAALDKFGFHKSFAVILGIQTVVCLSLHHVASEKTAFLIWIVMTFICEGGYYVLFPPLASDIYGAS